MMFRIDMDLKIIDIDNKIIKLYNKDNYFKGQ